MSVPRNRKEREKRELKIRVGVVFSCLALGLVGMVVCGYGHAAFGNELYISGIGTVEMSAPSFYVKYMQDMTPAVCSGATVGTSERLTDKRDGKMYWVAKLADGKCWMTQNLALDLTTDGLTSELTDLQESTVANYTTKIGSDGEKILIWDASSKYPPQATMATPFTASRNVAGRTSAQSTKPDRDYVMERPAANTTAKDEKQASIGAFTGVSIKDVTGWSPTYEFPDNAGPDDSPYNATARTYDAHYLFGNYYQWGAATAGSAQATSGKLATSSICPRGWRLPAEPGSVTEIETLAKTYGLASTVFTNAVGGASAAKAPLYFYLAGQITAGSQFYRVGQYVSYFTNKYYYGEAATSTIINNSGTAGKFTSSFTDAYTGQPIRCVAR